MSEEIKDQAVQDEKKIEGEINAEANFQQHMGSLKLSQGTVKEPEDETKVEDKKVEDSETKNKVDDKVEDKDKAEDKKEEKKEPTKDEVIAGLRKIAGVEAEIDLSKLQIEPAGKTDEKVDEKPAEKPVETLKPAESKEEPEKKEDDKPVGMTDEQFSNIQENKEAFIAYEDKKKSETILEISEIILKNLGNIVATSVQQQVQLQNIGKDFWENNKDLIPYAKRISAVSDKIASEHPDLPADKVYEFAGQHVRDQFNMIKQSENKDESKQEDKTTTNKGGFANSTSGNNGQSPDTDLNKNKNFQETEKLMKMDQITRPKIIDK